MAGIYETMGLRSINIFFITIGFFALIWDYKRTKHQKLDFVDAFLLCARTGFYYCLLYLPVILVFLSLSNSELQLVEAKETFNNNFSIIAIVFSTYIETVSTVVIIGIVAAFTGNTGNK
jgi:ABC-type sulfate transport system permease subunit